MSIDPDGAGNLYAIENNPVRKSILKFTPGNLPPTVVLDQITGFGFSPSDIFLDAEYNLYIADYWKRRVVRLAPGVTTQQVVAGGFGNGQALNRIDRANEIYVDPSGAMFVSDIGNDRVVNSCPEITLYPCKSA